MRIKIILLLGALLAAPAQLTARPQAPADAAKPAGSPFTIEKVMVPMRDGAKMETVIFRQRDKAGPLPILLWRTPYGVPESEPGRAAPAAMMRDGYIFVFQSMRGRFGSDGDFTLSTAVHPDDPEGGG